MSSCEASLTASKYDDRFFFLIFRQNRSHKLNIYYKNSDICKNKKKKQKAARDHIILAKKIALCEIFSKNIGTI